MLMTGASEQQPRATAEPELPDFNDYWAAWEQETYDLDSQLIYCDRDVSDTGIFS